MAKKLYEESNIKSIANAIREKNGKTAKYKVNEMAAAIQDIKIELPSNALNNVTGGNDYRFYGQGWNWFIEDYGNDIKKLYVDPHMFEWNNILAIPFQLDFWGYPCSYAFANCQQLSEITNIYVRNETAVCGSTDHLFDGCWRLKTLPDNMFGTVYKGGTNNRSYMFNKCYSLRKLPDLTNLNHSATYEKNLYVHLAYGAVALDEITNLPVTTNPNGLDSAFNHCYRVKNVTFATNSDGTPLTANWSWTTINLAGYVGWAYNTSYLTNYNAGVSPEIKTEGYYNLYKDTNNWYSSDKAFSRYNRTSAVNTINSLPDCSSGSSNIITFLNGSGSLTDGGAIETMTTEEIAVAAAKGWTVSFTDYPGISSSI